MPEGPEAHTMAKKLCDAISGCYIMNIDIIDSRHSKDLEKLPLPCLIHNVTGYGKRPIIETEHGYLMTFLCMHGRWLFKPSNHTRIILTIARTTGKGLLTITSTFQLYYDDRRSRGIGFVSYLSTVFSLLSYKFSVGVDLLIDTPDISDFIYRMRQLNSSSVAKALLSPYTTSTVGNYLKSEILYFSHVNPFKLVSECSDEELVRILYHAIRISRDSLNKEGFTMEDFLKPDGSYGTYVCSVYGREGECDSHGYRILRTVQDDRPTYWVRELQF